MYKILGKDENRDVKSFLRARHLVGINTAVSSEKSSRLETSARSNKMVADKGETFRDFSYGVARFLPPLISGISSASRG